MPFAWDEAKNQSNLQKHGIAFEDVLEVFDDPNVLVYPGRSDERTGEQRWQAIGLTSVAAQAVLLVVHVYRGADEKSTHIRIISAGKASYRERERYQAAHRQTKSEAAKTS